MATDDSLTRTRLPSPFEIGNGRSFVSELARRPEPEALAEPASLPPPVDDPDAIDPLPKASDDYVAFGRMSNKPLISLCFMLKDGSFDSFAYANLERVRLMPAAGPGGGNEIVLRFAGSVVTEVRLKGRNLATLHTNLGQHRTPWLRELPAGRDFKAASAVVITGFAFMEL